MIKTVKQTGHSNTWQRLTIMAVIIAVSAIMPLSAGEIFNSPVTANGEVLVFGGRVLDRLGNPVPNASVEIWQTDARGIYDHPGDSNTHRRDKGFQFFGTSVSDSSGSYMFRTINPGKYEPRPRHIHIKIRLSGRVLLTSQIYFSVDGETSGAGGSTRNLRMDITAVYNPGEAKSYTGMFDFIVDTGVRGGLRLTDRQAEGPYYPRDDVSLYDNDLANVVFD